MDREAFLVAGVSKGTIGVSTEVAGLEGRFLVLCLDSGMDGEWGMGGKWMGDGAEGGNGRDMACRLKWAPRRGCLEPTDFSSFDCDALGLGTGVKGRSASMGSSIGVVVVGIAAAESVMWGMIGAATAA